MANLQSSSERVPLRALQQNIDYSSSSSKTSGSRKSTDLHDGAASGKPDNAFLAVLQKCGLSTSIEGDQLQFETSSVDPDFDSQTLKHVLQEYFSSEIGSEDFIEAFKNFAADDVQLRLVLLPLKDVWKGALLQLTSLDDVGLVRCLLSVPCLQPPLIDFLLEKLPEYGEEGCTKGISRGDPTQQSIPTLIIRQMRLLEYVVDSNRVTDKLLECLQVCEGQVQKDIVGLLPEVIEDAQQPMVVEALTEMLRECPALLMSILDCFNNLNLEPEQTTTVTDSVLDLLHSAPEENLPLLLRFLLSRVNKSNAANVINRIRESVTFSLAANQRGGGVAKKGISMSRMADEMGSKRHGLSTGANASNEMLTLEVLARTVRFRHQVADFFFKEITAVPDAGSHKPMDFWFCVVSFSVPSHRRQVESLLKKKAKEGKIDKKLVTKSVIHHGSMLNPHFAVLLDLASIFLRDGHESVRDIGQVLYMALFYEFKSSFSHQEIVGSIVAHAGSAFPTEVDSALVVLTRLADHFRRQLLPYLPFVQQLLDFTESLTDAQIRQVFRAICLVAGAGAISVKGSSDSRRELDELHITIRKQLAHPADRYCRAGIIGAVTLIACKLSSQRAESFSADNFLSSLQGCRSSDHLKKREKISTAMAQRPQRPGTSSPMEGERQQEEKEMEAKKIFALLLSSCRASATRLAFLYEELVSLVEDASIPNNMIEWMSQLAMGELEERFIGDFGSEGQNPEKRSSGGNEDNQLAQPKETWTGPSLLGGALQTCFTKNLDGPEAVGYVRIADTLSSPGSAVQQQQHHQQLAQLCPLFRFLAAAELRVNGGLDDLDGVLGCPLLLPRLDPYFSGTDAHSTSAKERSIVALSLWYAVDWCRELLNVFSDQESAEMRRKVVRRILDLKSLECALSRLLMDSPHLFLPPLLALKGNNDETAPRAAPRLPKAQKPKAIVAENDVDGVKGKGPAWSSNPSKDKSKGPGGSFPPLPCSSTSSFLSLGISPADVARLPLRALRPEVCLILAHKPVSYAFSALARHGEKARTSTDSEALSVEAIELILEAAANTVREAMPKPRGFGGRGSSADSLYTLDTLLSTFAPVVLPALKCHLKGLGQYLEDCQGGQARLDEVTAEAGEPLVPDEAPDPLKQHLDRVDNCFTQIFFVIRKLVVERAGQSSPQAPSDPIQMCLRIFTDRKDTVAETEIFRECFHFFAQFSTCPRSVGCAMELLLLLECLVHAERGRYNDGRRLIGSKEQMKTAGRIDLELSEICLSYLHSKWDAQEDSKYKSRGSPFSLSSSSLKIKIGKALPHFVQLHLLNAPDLLEAVEMFAVNVFPEFLSKGTAQDFPMLTKNSFLNYFRPTLEAITVHFSTLLFHHSLSDPEAMLYHTHRTTLLLHALVSISRCMEKRQLISCILRQGKKFVEDFLRCLPWLQGQFPQRPQRVLSILSALQKTTRQMQSLCAHGKSKELHSSGFYELFKSSHRFLLSIKDVSISAQVPQMKKLLEKLILEVKTVVQANDCLEAFTIGNLKHRALDGSYISEASRKSQEEARSTKRRKKAPDHSGRKPKREEDDEEDEGEKSSEEGEESSDDHEEEDEDSETGNESEEEEDS